MVGVFRKLPCRLQFSLVLGVDSRLCGRCSIVVINVPVRVSTFMTSWECGVL